MIRPAVARAVTRPWAGVTRSAFSIRLEVACSSRSASPIPPASGGGGFVPGLALAGILPPGEVTGLLTARLATLDKENAKQRSDLSLWTERLPRVLLIETEYQLAMRVAQAGWLRGLLVELVAGTISGMDSWRRLHDTGEVPAEFAELDALAKRGWEENREEP